MFFEKTGKRKAVTFSYDDGVTQDVRLVELLNKYGLKCTFNLNSELLAKKGILLRNGLRIAHYKVHPEDVRDIYEGHEVAGHTLTHPSLPRCEEPEVIRQVEEDRLRLSELVGYEVVGMAYPGGGVNNDDRVAEIIRRSTGVRYKPDKPQVFYIWGHSYEMDYAPDYWIKLEAFFELISGREDIYYGTNKEVLLG